MDKLTGTKSTDFKDIQISRLINPDLIIVGGGVSKRAEKWLPRAAKGVRAKVVSAKLHNEAGIVGAAMAAGKIR